MGGIHDNATEKAPEIAESGTEASISALDSLLHSCTQSVVFQPIAADHLNFFDGTVRLTVRNEATGALFVSRPLTAAEQSQLLLELEYTGTPVSAEDANGSTNGKRYAVWITLGDGQVVTPCLALTGGNVGAGVLFDYSTERIPSAAFFRLVNGMI